MLLCFHIISNYFSKQLYFIFSKYQQKNFNNHKKYLAFSFFRVIEIDNNNKLYQWGLPKPR
ncbi:MAG TPA: hypothetical protein DIC64_03885 [Alphaproteobacteria bacterium]|nr:hypothetical protein [Alphaproteobacteria bacterium]